MKETLQATDKITRQASGIAVALLFLSLSVPVLGQNYSLYSPKLWSPQEKAQAEKQNGQVEKETESIEKEKEPVKAEKRPIKKVKVPIKRQKVPVRNDQVFIKDGVLFREVTVQEGDTISSISRKFSKEGSSYSETLRFNGMEQADLIYSGDIIKVPVDLDKAVKQRKPAKKLQPALAPAPKQPATAKPAGLALHRKTVGSLKPLDGGKGGVPVDNERTALPKPALKVLVKTPRVEAPPVSATMDIRRLMAFHNNTTSKQQSSQPPETKTLQPAPAKAVTVFAKTVREKEQTFSENTLAGQKLFEQAVKSYRLNDCKTAVHLFARFLAENTNSIFAADASLYNADCYLMLSRE